jgi:DNA uptake protein ComE-like DNA-binding protein
MNETMKYRNLVLLAASAAMVLGSGLAMAAAAKAESAQTGASQAQASPAVAAPAKAGKSAKVKLVDINAATIAQLKTLPGIDDAVAAKIIAGRPYGSKAQLLTRNIVDASVYAEIGKLVVAKQPFKDAAKNAAQFAPKK